MGSGVGAERHCIFTTGEFVEPITTWDEPRQLAFNVREQPDPMIELTPYRHIHPPHLDLAFRSVRGEFDWLNCRTAARGSPAARGTSSTCGRMHIGRSGPIGSCTAFTSACCGISSDYAKKEILQRDAVASVAGSKLFGIGRKLALTRWAACRIFPTHDEDMSAQRKRQVVVEFENKISDCGVLAIYVFERFNPSPRRPTNHVEGSTPWLGRQLTPQRLALARKPPIRYDTLPDARQSLPPP